jgi:uncharacterized membrane protein YqaE (UPF0057 family)
MKKLFASIILFTASALLLSSCSSSSSIALTKRHYRSGYYVDWRSKRNTISAPTITNITRRPQESSSITVSKPESPAVVNTPVLVSEKSKAIQITTTAKYKDAVAERKIDNAILAQNTTLINALAPESSKGIADHQDRVDDNVAFVVIVLCAIFIPPLGVGLMYGIHAYFWIDLILTLIFFFPGMIFALIVVLS